MYISAYKNPYRRKYYYEVTKVNVKFGHDKEYHRHIKLEGKYRTPSDDKTEKNLSFFIYPHTRTKEMKKNKRTSSSFYGIGCMKFIADLYENLEKEVKKNWDLAYTYEHKNDEDYTANVRLALMVDLIKMYKMLNKLEKRLQIFYPTKKSYIKQFQSRLYHGEEPSEEKDNGATNYIDAFVTDVDAKIKIASSGVTSIHSIGPNNIMLGSEALKLPPQGWQECRKSDGAISYYCEKDGKIETERPSVRRRLASRRLAQRLLKSEEAGEAN